MKEYEQKYDFINKALLESVAHISELTHSDHHRTAAKVKSVDKMVMLPTLFDGTNQNRQNSTMRDSINILNSKPKMVMSQIQLVKQ